MSRYDRDPRVSYEHGGYTIHSGSRHIRVMPYEGGHRWGVFTGPAGSPVLGMPSGAREYHTADQAIAAVLGPAADATQGEDAT